MDWGRLKPDYPRAYWDKELYLQPILITPQNKEPITSVEDLYGILVKVKHERRGYDFPLCDLEATDSKSPNYGFLRDYVVWFANR